MNTITTPAVPLTKVTPAFRIKEPGSAITHFIGMIAAAASMPFLLEKALAHNSSCYPISVLLFMGSMILLYAASTVYHAVIAAEKTTLFLKKLDHIMIYFLIAGSYTPVCLLVLPSRQGMFLCTLVWAFAIAGLFLSLVWINSPKWLNSTIYIIMGWLCLLNISTIYANMSAPCFAWLFAGGVIYTIGGIIYALKLPVLNSLLPNFGSHEIFHLFVMAGSFCHIIVVYGYLI